MGMVVVGIGGIVGDRILGMGGKRLVVLSDAGENYVRNI